MAKKVGIRFENIKGMIDYGEDAPRPVEDNKIDKDFIGKIQDAGHKVVVYAESSMITEERDSSNPDFQKALIKAIIKKRLDEKEIPYDSVEYDSSGLDINLNYEITRYKNWEDVLVSVLEETK